MHGDLEAWLETASGSDEEFVEGAWILLLRRAVEPEVKADTVARLAAGALSRSGVLRDLAASEEFAAVTLLDDAVSHAAAARAAPRAVAGPARPRLLTAPAWSGERALEIPWCLARYDGEQRVLDIGYAFAEPAYLAALLTLGIEELTGADLAHRLVPGMRTVVADVRDLPFADRSLELVLCLSTLEHVGRDNDVYAVDAPREQGGDEAALRELRRVLASTGRVLVSVPTGVHDDQGWQVQRPPESWIERFEASGFTVFEDELYVRDADGWRSGTLAEAQAARYGANGPGADAVLLAELRPRSIGERLRLAVRDRRHPDEPRRSTLT